MISAAILLLIVAAALVGAELFLPSHGIMGLLAILCALLSVILAARVSPFLGLVFGLAVLVMTPVVFYYAIKLYPTSPVGKRVMLSPPSARIATGSSEETARLQGLVGQRGVAMTMLRPSGSVDLNGERVNCVAESEIIYPNTAVEVIQVSGRRVIVKALEEGERDSAAV